MNISKHIQVTAALIRIRFTFGVQNVHLTPAYKLYDRTACGAQSSVYH